MIHRAFDWTYAAISKVSPLLYLLIYLALIPAFAGIYAYGAGQAFYAPYAKFEPAATADVYAFEQRLLARFDRAAQTAPRSTHGWQIKPDPFNVLIKPGPGTDQFSVSVILGLTRTDRRGREDQDNVPFQTIVSMQPVIITAEPYQVCHPVVPVRNEAMLDPDGPEIFHALFHGAGPCEAGDYLVLDADGERRFTALLAGIFGDSSKFSGQYGRMLYFSAITVTTVGFGDIIPITDTSRLYVGLEAVLGMILSGLFLNAVGWRIARAKPANAKL